ncbi:glycosyltransferase [Flavobacteriaceae bacterium Ap0902]|nr:glycosyltransferase [Flavobacteriaceae bacterium Ap0902]
MNPQISILTPTYNRAHLLNRVYNSLLSQSNLNFEWLIIDDGSIDNTEEVIKHFNTEKFPIIYLKKENGGKHTALNLGVKEASGEYILMLDSDDTLPHNAITIISQKVENLPAELGGVVGRKSDLQGEIIGNKNQFNDLITNSLDIRYKYGIEGDLTEVFRTSVFKQFLFPEIKNEKFCPEILVWNRIAFHYDLLFFDKSIYTADYQSGGLTDQIIKIRMNSPKASMLTYSELANYHIPLKEKLKASINFWRFSFNDKDWSLKEKINMSIRWMIPITYPLGLLMHLKDKRKVS